MMTRKKNIKKFASKHKKVSISFNEAAIRDSLADNISIFESGLVLDKKEKFIPNKYGTRSFIDIVAHDNNGRIVLIEVKKTKQAEREAIHEIIKYLEGVKQYLRLREDEIRVFVASPNWEELIIPFSSFVQRTTCHVEGFKLHLTETGEVTKAELVKPLKMEGDRFIAPWHELRYYVDEARCNDAIKKIEAICLEKGLDNYILLELHPSQGHEDGICSPKQGTMRQAIGMMSNSKPRNIHLPLYKRALYFAMQQLSEAEYLRVLENRPDDARNTLDNLEDIADSEERIFTLHQAVCELPPHAPADSFEIAYPAKLTSRLLTDDGWMVGRIYRYGAFKRNVEILSDDQIVKEISGEEGSSSQAYSKKFSPFSKTQLSEISNGVERCLSENPAWRKQIAEVLREIAVLKDSKEAEISLFHPSTALLTFYLAAKENKPQQYLPNYHLRRKVGSKDVLVYGCLVWDGSISTLRSVIQKHYNNSASEMLNPLLWGGYDVLDNKVMRTIGFRYKTFRVDVDGTKINHFSLTEEGWEPMGPLHPHDNFYKFFDKNSSFAREICDFYSKHWNGSMVFL